ncbi:MAG: peptidoglycan-binding protein, partial [Clostridiales bacterium]|nr:peptidoglycan-binding protein [Clostridiales bacterium]
KELGYYSYGCDGDFGERTATAVKAFQKMNGLTQDGVVGATTLTKLNSTSAIPAKGADVPLNSNQTLQKGDSGAQVKALQKRLKELGYYTNSLDSDYGLRTATAVSEFQRANGLTVNGIANSTTIKKMLSSSAVTKAEADKKEQEQNKIKTENLDWFKNGKAVFDGRPVIQVKDVRTGLVFKARVLFGTNHLDVEPLTKADTAILLKINGGVDFSWRRRPMLVKLNGHVYAASIYSQPHGEQTILDNNFDGQFCLHFSGSKTHGTDVVDSNHQACVAEALKATW